MTRAGPVCVCLLLLAACGEDDDTRAPAITALTPRTHEAFFPISSGAHQGLDCNACHGQFDTFLQFECRDCHKHQKDTTDAIHSGMDGYAYESEACLSCHPRGAAADFEGHDERFPISEGAAHAGVSCSSCHLDPDDRTQISCASGTCHPAAEVSPPHEVVGGFAFDQAECLRCHADGQVDRVSAHTPFAIASGGKHEKQACLTCHPQPRADKTFGANFAVRTCVDGSCHPQPETTADHAGIPGFTYATASCELCHPTGSASDAVDHDGRFPIGAGTSHASATCDECHRDPVSGKNVSCATGCHTSAGHASAAMNTAHSGRVGGYRYEDALCLRCHAETPAWRVTSHPRIPEENFDSGDHRSRCLSCHQALRTDRPYPAADFGKTDCRGSGCHSSATGPGED